MICVNNIIIEEVDSKDFKIDDLVNSLMKKKLFNDFLGRIKFKEEARKKATNAIINIAQNYRPMCYMVTHPIKCLAKVF